MLRRNSYVGSVNSWTSLLVPDRYLRPGAYGTASGVRVSLLIVASGDRTSHPDRRRDGAVAKSGASGASLLVSTLLDRLQLGLGLCLSDLPNFFGEFVPALPEDSSMPELTNLDP
jgi:hypothetical protein